MTSSLVGSEMCIRDSFMKPLCYRRGRQLKGAGAHGPRQAQENTSPKPVSYTHLTLPTICSV
eukprot:9355161-Prorocentrum_lima.AAC.1